MPLTAAKVASIKKAGRYSDGGNLALQVTASGNKSWSFIYMRYGRSRQMGLGPVALVTLAQARDLAFRYRKMLHEGIDPIEHRKAQKYKSTATTFRDFAEEFVTTQEPGWRNKKSPAQWRSSLKNYAYPTIGELPVDAITTDHLMHILNPIWASKTVTGDRVRTRIGAILDAAKARGLRAGDNPAAWRGNLKTLLPPVHKTRKKKHHPALAHPKVPGFMKRLRASDSISARALEFTILTAVRANETIGAIWSEIDIKKKLWVIPAARMKMERDHRVPLSDAALKVLAQVPREDENQHVFIGEAKTGGLSNMAMLELLRGMQPGVTVHGMRSSFRDWAGEETTYPGDMLDLALAHKVSDETEAAYRRGDMFKKRRALMDDWAKFVAKGKTGPPRRMPSEASDSL